MSLPKHNHILKTPTKKTQKKKTQKDPKNPRSNHEIPKSKIGERERERQRNLRSKNNKVLRRKREYLRHGGLRTALTMSSDCLRDYLRDNGYEFASALGYEFAL